MLTIDGSFGEGGGQILRTSLSLAILASIPFRIHNIRKNRARPGLLAQHLTAVRAAAEISDALVEGAELGSEELSFFPKQACGGEYHFDVGTAGSTMLVFQTLLLPLLFTDKPSRVHITGGTHAEGAPTFEFIERCYLPLLRRMGAIVELRLEKAGFYPIGGGHVVAQITPVSKLAPLVLHNRGEVTLRAIAVTANLPSHIAGRELNYVSRHLSLSPSQTEYKRFPKNWGTGNVLYMEVRGKEHTELCTSFGALGKPSETVAAEICEQTDEMLRSNAASGLYLSDQLVLPCSLTSGSRYTVENPSLHLKSSVQIINTFLGNSVAGCNEVVRLTELNGLHVCTTGRESP